MGNPVYQVYPSSASAEPVTQKLPPEMDHNGANKYKFTLFLALFFTILDLKSVIIA